MANPEHLAKLKQGVKRWSEWRKQNPGVQPDLSGADLSKAKLIEADLNGANLCGARLSEATLEWADLRGSDLSAAWLVSAVLGEAELQGANLCGARLGEADLEGADLTGADLSGADLSGVALFDAILSEANLTRANLEGADLFLAHLVRSNLRGADLSGANLHGADLAGTDLAGADLTHATLVDTNLEGANLTGCFVFGISAWRVRLEGAIQKNLVITPKYESPIQVDNLEVAQFIYLLLNNEKIRSVIDTITSKVVLILGRFTPDRKVVLDAIRDELRNRGYSPVLFDFEKPSSQTTVETISTLAHMARFVIADLTDAKSVLQELQAVVPLSPSVVVQPLLLASQEEPGMFDFFRRYPWVLATHRYTDQAMLLAELEGKVIAPADAKAKELTGK
ncbi:MAG: pentapeptide repeat-containing protein [Terriglobales bacterium]